MGFFTKKKEAEPLVYDLREITLIRTPAELDTFMKQCGISEITKEY